MSDALLVIGIVVFFLAAWGLLHVCGRVIAVSVEEAERDDLTSGRGPERRP